MYRPVILWLLLCGSVAAHDMTPTYPKWKMSFIPTAKMTTMKVFNKRADVQWYQIGVFDKEFKPIPFVTRYKILRIKYLSHVKFDIYINDDNVELTKDKTEYNFDELKQWFD